MLHFIFLSISEDTLPQILLTLSHTNSVCRSPCSIRAFIIQLFLTLTHLLIICLTSEFVCFLWLTCSLVSVKERPINLQQLASVTVYIIKTNVPDHKNCFGYIAVSTTEVMLEYKLCNWVYIFYPLVMDYFLAMAALVCALLQSRLKQLLICIQSTCLNTLWTHTHTLTHAVQAIIHMNIECK